MDMGSQGDQVRMYAVLMVLNREKARERMKRQLALISTIILFAAAFLTQSCENIPSLQGIKNLKGEIEKLKGEIEALKQSAESNK